MENININDLNNLIIQARNEKEVAIDNEFAQVTQDVIAPKFAELDTLYAQAEAKAIADRDEAIANAENVRNLAIENANSVCQEKIEEAQKLVNEKKIKFSNEQKSIVSVKIGAEYDPYINALDAVAKKFGG